MHDMAEHLKMQVPVRLDQFFDTVESGNWDEIEAAFKSLSEYKRNLIEQEDSDSHASSPLRESSAPVADSLSAAFRLKQPHLLVKHRCVMPLIPFGGGKRFWRTSKSRHLL